MGLKTLELTINSAKDLKNVNLIGKMDVYVVVYLSDNPNTKQKTPVHQDGGTNPSWNYTMRFTVDEAAAAAPGKYLIFKLKHETTLGADKDLGEVLVPLKELLDGVKNRDPSIPQILAYQVRTSSGKAKGELKFSCKFIDMGQPAPIHDYGKSSCSSSSYSAPGGYPTPPGAAPHAYPPPSAAGCAAAYPSPASTAAYPPPATTAAYPPPATTAAYPPQEAQKADGRYPQHGPPTAVPYAAPAPSGSAYPPYGGYPPGPHPGYGYPPPGAYPPAGGYGYPGAGYGPQVVQQAQKPKKNKFGMGLGAGLIGGALGGLVLGEMVDDVYDSGYDAGFDDSGFDF